MSLIRLEGSEILSEPPLSSRNPLSHATMMARKTQPIISCEQYQMPLQTRIPVSNWSSSWLRRIATSLFKLGSL